MLEKVETMKQFFFEYEQIEPKTLKLPEEDRQPESSRIYAEPNVRGAGSTTRMRSEGERIRRWNKNS